MKTPFSLAASSGFFFGTQVRNSWNNGYLNILLYFAPVGEKFSCNWHSFMKYRTIWIALSAFLNSDQMSSNRIKTTFWAPALSLEVRLAFQPPELANNYCKRDLLSIPLPRPGCRGYSYFCSVSEERTLDGQRWLNPNAIPPHVPFWGGHVVRVHLQALVEPGRKGHLSHSDCDCKDSEPGAITAYPWRKPAWEWSQNKEKHCWEMEKNWI